MGRSMSLARSASGLEKLASPITIYSSQLNRYFQVYSNESELYQSEYELDPSGKEVFRNTHKLEYLVGAGMNGYGYIVNRGGFLFQAPLSYYAQTKEWNLSPGYEAADVGFNRPILAGCIFCHSGRPQAHPNGNGRYGHPPFLELAIGCENCHGPGHLHATERGRGVRISGSVDRSIVNPARLPARLAEDICMYCHQGGDTRVLQPGKDYSDFRPGTSLNDTLAIFKIPARPGGGEHSDLLEHHFATKLSKCYTATEGKLSCLTCHDPHSEPAAEQAPAYYRNKCQTCHSDKSCRLPLEARRQTMPSNDCVSCHMPKRDVHASSHSALTNHRIVARPDEGYPEIAYHQTTPDLPDLVHLNRRPDDSGLALSAVTLLQAYGDLLAKDPAFGKRYLMVLDQLSQSQPKDPVVLAALGRKAMAEGTPEANKRARDYLAKAVDAGATAVTTFQDLAEVLARMGRLEEAVNILKRGIGLAPYSQVLHKLVALRLMNLKRYAEAKDTMRRYVELFPEDSFVRTALRQVESSGK